VKSVSKFPDVPWENIAGLDEIKDTLIKINRRATTYPHVFENKLHPSQRDFALWSTGTGKTLLVKVLPASGILILYR